MFQTGLLGQVCDKAYEKVSNAPVVRWIVRILQLLVCLIVVQTAALLWIGSSVAALKVVA